MLLPHAKSIAHTHTRARGVICAKRKRTKKKMGSIQKYRSFWLYSGRLDSLPSLRLVVRSPPEFNMAAKNSGIHYHFVALMRQFLKIPFFSTTHQEIAGLIFSTINAIITLYLFSHLYAGKICHK